MTVRQALLGELTFEAENTRKLFNAITDDILLYRPNDFNWTIAELASHTAQIYNWWPLTMNKNVLELSTYQYDKGDITNMEGIKRKLEENIINALSSLENYPVEKFGEMWSMQNEGVDVMPPMPRIRVIRSFLMNHLYHHRGELIAYMRANGKPVPGLYGPSYEEQAGIQV